MFFYWEGGFPAKTMVVIGNPSVHFLKKQFTLCALPSFFVVVVNEQQ